MFVIKSLSPALIITLMTSSVRIESLHIQNKNSKKKTARSSILTEPLTFLVCTSCISIREGEKPLQSNKFRIFSSEFVQ